MALDDALQDHTEPIIRIDFADLPNRRSLGNSLSLQAIVHELHSQTDFPNAEKKVNHPAELFTLHSVVNRDYWRDIAKYTMRHRAFCGVGLAATNISGKLARRVRIEIECSKSTGVRFLNASNIPDFPVFEESALKMPRIPLANNPLYPLIEPDIRAHDDRWTIDVSFGDIQSKATAWADRELYISAKGSGIYTLKASVYSDDIGQPQESLLSIDFSIESRPRLTFEEVKEIEAKHHDASYEKYLQRTQEL